MKKVKYQLFKTASGLGEDAEEELFRGVGWEIGLAEAGDFHRGAQAASHQTEAPKGEEGVQRGPQATRRFHWAEIVPISYFWARIS